MASKDYYEILGVSKNATADEIKKAYRAKAKQYHPDMNEDKKAAEEKFKEASEAYSVLSDETKRAQYDRFGSAFDSNGYAGYGTGSGFDFSGFSNGGMGFDIDLEDILGSVFGGGFGGFKSAKNGPAKGTDLRYNMKLTFEEAVFGTSKQISITRNEKCSSCSGTGAKAGSSKVTCDKCAGKGKVQAVQNTIMGTFSTVKTCDKCGGTGFIIKEPCEVCSGAGHVRKTRKIDVNIPSGIDNGQAIALTGQGDIGKNGGPNGDLFIVVTVMPHKIFKRQGSTISFDKTIPFVKAVLGGPITIATLEGEETFNIPEGTQPGTVFTLKNRGVPSRGSRGNLEFKVQIEIPKKLTDKQRELLEQYAISCSEEVNTKKKGFFGK
ncbi:MAG: molecular chaperone DnaJ [Clostridia bacterium]|nr:molecular chaperone DnaJ [Clostridia bacterium]